MEEKNRILLTQKIRKIGIEWILSYRWRISYFFPCCATVDRTTQLVQRVDVGIREGYCHVEPICSRVGAVKRTTANRWIRCFPDRMPATPLLVELKDPIPFTTIEIATRYDQRAAYRTSARFTPRRTKIGTPKCSIPAITIEKSLEKHSCKKHAIMSPQAQYLFVSQRLADISICSSPCHTPIGRTRYSCVCACIDRPIPISSSYRGKTVDRRVCESIARIQPCAAFV